MAITEIPRPHEWRMDRLNRAVARRVLIEQEGSDGLITYPYKNQLTPSKHTHEEARKVMDYGIVLLFLDVVRNGATMDVLEAIDTVQQLRSYLRPADTPNGIPLLETPHGNGDLGENQS